MPPKSLWIAPLLLGASCASPRAAVPAATASPKAEAPCAPAARTSTRPEIRYYEISDA